MKRLIAYVLFLSFFVSCNATAQNCPTPYESSGFWREALVDLPVNGTAISGLTVQTFRRITNRGIFSLLAVDPNFRFFNDPFLGNEIGADFMDEWILHFYVVELKYNSTSSAFVRRPSSSS